MPTDRKYHVSLCVSMLCVIIFRMNIPTKSAVVRKQFSLDCGVSLTTYEKTDAPIAFRVTFLAGSRFDPRGKEGLAHFVEHMFLAQEGHHGSRQELALWFEERGGSISALTKLDTIQFDFVIADVGDLPDALAIFTGLLNFASSSDTLETERRAIQSEMRRKNSTQTEPMIRAIYNNLFEGSPVTRPTVGTEAGISSITQEDIQSYYRDMCTANKMSVIITGGVCGEEVLRMCNTAFASLQINSTQAVCLDAPAIMPKNKHNPVILQQNKEAKEILIAIYFCTVPTGTRDALILELVANVFTGSPASLFYRVLRYERGLLYKIDASQQSRCDFGLFSIWTSCAHEHAIGVLEGIREILSCILREEVREADVVAAKHRMINSERVRMQTVESIVEKNAYGILINKDFDYETYMGQLESISVDEMQSVAQKYFTPSNWSMNVVGNIEQKNIERLQTWTPIK